MKTKYIMVHEDLRKKILSGVYKENEKLPSDIKLTEHYKVSMITIKRAMNILVEENLIERISGRGSFVKSNINVGKKSILSLIIPEFSDIFGLEILNEFERLCRDNNIMPLVSRSFGSQSLENKIINEHIELGTEGIIIMPVHDEFFNEEILKLSLNKFPIVSIDRELKSLPISFVATDNYESTMKLVRHLKKLDHKKGVIIAPRYVHSLAISERIQAMNDNFKSIEIIYYDSGEFFNNGQNPQKIKSLLETYIDILEKCDFIFCIEYEVLNIINELNIYNKKVICFDYPMNETKIKVAHIKQKQKEIATCAFNAVRELQKIDVEPQRIKIIGDFVEADDK